MKSLLIIFVFISFFNSLSIAQDDLAEYKRAKTFIGYGNYPDAMESLRPYLDAREYGTLALFATYHYAHAAYLHKQFSLAIQSLEPLMENRSWQNIDEARYLLALAYFQAGSNLDALREISAIKDPGILDDAEKASFRFLQNESVSFLISHLEKYDNNQGYVQALKSQMAKQTIMTVDERAVYNQLRSLGNESNSSQQKTNSYLDIALILPFKTSGNIGGSPINTQNFVFELYQGIHFAIEDLRKSGIQINIQSYDSERSAEKLKKILADPFMAIADVIIGPIYPEETEIVASYAELNSIPFINPLSNLDESFESMKYAYLFRPSVSSISKGVVDFLANNVDGKKIAIAYSGATRDELLSKKTEQLAKERGFQVIVNNKVSDSNIRGFFGDIGITRNLNTKVDAVVIFSDDPNIASPTFGLLESINVDIPVIVIDSWLYFNFSNFEMLQTQNFHFVGNNAINFNSEELNSFRNGFYEKYYSHPSLNAHLGFELVHWLSDNLNKVKGFDLRKSLDREGYYPGKISYGMNFESSNNNTYIPILKLEEGELVVK